MSEWTKIDLKDKRTFPPKFKRVQIAYKTNIKIGEDYHVHRPTAVCEEPFFFTLLGQRPGVIVRIPFERVIGWRLNVSF